MSRSPDDPVRRDDLEIRGERTSHRPEADPRIDSLLRETAGRGMRLPGLVELFSDDAIDRLLRDVPCRMESIRPFAAPGGRRVPVDLDAVVAGLDRQPPRPAAGFTSRPSRLVRSAIGVARDAFNVVAVLSVVVAMFAASVVASRWLSTPLARVTATAPHGLDFSASSAAPRDTVVTVIADGRDFGQLDPPAGEGNPSDSSIPGKGGVEVIADADAANLPEGEGTDGPRIAFDDSGDSGSSLLPGGPPPEVRAAPVSVPGLGLQSSSQRRKPYRSAGESLEVVATRPAIGRFVPYHRGYDLAFEMNSGESPFVDPSLTRALAVDSPPLSRRTDSFDRVEQLLAAGGLRRDRLRQAITGLRVEEVLAAISPAALPAAPPAAAPVVSVAAGASISGRPNARLLEVSIVAPRLASQPAGDLLFVLDASAAAGADEAWPAVCRGVEDAVRRLDPGASITVVAFAERPVVIANQTPARDMVDLRRRLLEVRPRGGGDLHGCMAIVRDMVARREMSPRCVVVAHAGSIARAERDGDPGLAAWRRSQQRARDGDASPILEVVEIDSVSGATGEAAEKNGASLVEGVGLDSMVIRRSIVAAALGPDSAPRFEACRLEVAFDPAQVAAYRLVGHRRQIVEMASSQSSAVDLADGECVRAVYEVVLRERDPRGRAPSRPQAFTATATCLYRRAGEASESRVVAGISPSQIAVDPSSGDAASQAVWLSVAIAELAAGSAHVESPQRLREAVRLSFERVGDGSTAPAGWEGSMLRRLRAIWTAL